MASSVYSSKPETTNANRACRVVLGPSTDGLRDILRHYVPPSTFPSVIKLKEDKLPRLTAVQCNIILPKNGSYTGRYDDMDISLLYVLLRNIAGIYPHSNGWGNDPDPRDTSLSANIERIRLVRNRCVHSCDPFMSNTDFNSIWSTIRYVMVDLDVFLMTGNKYERDVDFLRHESMDPERDVHYKNELRKQVEEDEKTREMVVQLKRKIEETSERVEKLKDKMKKSTASYIPSNVREQYDIDVQKWKEEDGVYYETHYFPLVMEKMRKQPYVTFVGVPGSGKSAMAHHIAVKLKEEGYEVVPTKDVRKMEDYGDPRNPQVFVIDDVVGVFGLQKIKLDVLTDYEHKITNPCMVRSKTLMTCREVVFNEMLPYKSFLTKEETVIKLHSTDNELNDKDKKQILQKYDLDVHLLSPALLKSTSRMFPFLCKIFSKEKAFQAFGSKFFLNPVICIIDEINDMQRHNKLNYATLVLCMLNENSLSEDIFDDEKFIDMKMNVLVNCKLDRYTDTFNFMDALSVMEGTYTKQCGALYTFTHDSLFEICAYQYGKQFPEQMLLYMSSSYIANNVRPQTSGPANVNKMKEKQSDSQYSNECESSNGKGKQSDNLSIEGDESSDDSDGKEKESDDQNNERIESFDLCVWLREDQYPLLAERFYRDIENMELYDVFRNPVLKHPQVCQAFVSILETKPYTELKSLFLSTQENVHKIVSKNQCMVEESRKLNERKVQEMLVDQSCEYIFKDDDVGMLNPEREIFKYNVRVISWVIYYGHHHILHFMVQQIEQHKQMSELFRITGNATYQSESWNYIFNTKQSKIETLVEQFRLLVLSCYSGDVQTVRILLNVCEDACIYWNPFYLQVSPLIAACQGGHVDIVEELVKAGIDVNGMCNNKDTPLYAACNEGNAKVVEELVKAGVDLNLQNRSIMAACYEGHASVVRVLAKAGISVNLQDEWGNTPLTTACFRGYVSVVKELVKAGAEINLQDASGNTPLMIACFGTIRNVEKLEKATDAHCELSYVEVRMSVVKELVKAGADINQHNVVRNTPLLIACHLENMSLVRELLEAGADVNLQDEFGNTPLTNLCKKGNLIGVKELIAAEADVDLYSRCGNTPLIAACEGGHISVVHELVKAGVDVNLHNHYRDIPFLQAVRYCPLSTIKYLVEHKTDWITQVPDIGVSAIYRALILNKLDTLKYLIQEQNKIAPGKFIGNMHLFNCLVEIRHTGVTIDSRDDVVVTDNSVWCMERSKDWWQIITCEDCALLSHLVCVGLDGNQSIQFYDKYKNNRTDVKPLLHTLIDECCLLFKEEKVNLLLSAGANVNTKRRS